MVSYLTSRRIKQKLFHSKYSTQLNHYIIFYFLLTSRNVSFLTTKFGLENSRMNVFARYYNYSTKLIDWFSIYMTRKHYSLSITHNLFIQLAGGRVTKLIRLFDDLIFNSWRMLPLILKLARIYFVTKKILILKILAARFGDLWGSEI